MKTTLLLLPLCLMATGAFANTKSNQTELYVAPFAGYSFASNGLDVQIADTQTESLNVTESENFGLMLGMRTRDPGSIYLLYSRQATDLRSGSFNPDKLIDLDINYLHVGGTLYFSHDALKPYITASVGVTQLRPSKQYSTETNFSMGFGGGVLYEISPNISIFADVRAYGTFADASSSLFCDETQCKWNISADVIWQSQGNIGAEFRF